MKVRSILLACLFANSLFANISSSGVDHSKILKDFGIVQNAKNLSAIAEISRSVDMSDKRRFKNIVRSQQRHAFLVKDKLEQINAPEFMLYLAMVESKLSNKVTSSASAGGMWQFMPSTARKFGLSVNSNIDQRRDPQKSTNAAFKYMSYLKRNFGKWYLALMAYNCGEGCVSKILSKSKSSDFATLIKSPVVPNETKNFMKNIIKYAYVADTSDVKNMMSYMQKPFEVKKIPVASGVSLADIGRKIGVSVASLENLNTHVKNASLPLKTNGYFYIPGKKYDLYMSSLNTNGKKAINLDKYKKSKFGKMDFNRYIKDDEFSIEDSSNKKVASLSWKNKKR